MKTNSCKIIRNDTNEYEISSYPIYEIQYGEDKAQELVDDLHDNKTNLDVLQKLQSEGFELAESVKRSYPDPRKLVEKFESKVQEEVEKRIKLIEEKAFEEGFEKAKESGYQAGLQKVKEEVAPFIQEMTEMAEKFRKIREEMVIKNEKLLVKIIISIIENIIMDEYITDETMVRTMIHSVVRMTGEREDIEVHLNKYDFDRIKEFSRELSDALSLKNGIRLEVDPKIEKGGCRVFTNLGLIDASLDQQVAKLKKELLGRVPAPNTNYVQEQKEKTQNNTALQKEKVNIQNKTSAEADKKVVNDKTVTQTKIVAGDKVDVNHENKVKKSSEISSKDVADLVKDKLKKDE